MDFYINARNIFNQDGGTYRLRSDRAHSAGSRPAAIWSTGVRATF
jgi:hypothetical protein